MVRTLDINQKTNLKAKHCLEGFRAHATHATKNLELRSRGEAEIKSSSKSYRFFIKRACSFLVEDKLFNQKIKLFNQKLYFREDLLCLNI